MNDKSDRIERNLPGGDENPSGTIALFTRSEGDAMSVLRIEGPAAFSGMNVLHGVEDGIIRYHCAREANIVVIQREFPTDLEAYELIVSQARQANKPVVMDLDDLLLELPADHPDRKTHEYTNSLLPMLQAIMDADLVTVPSATLREHLLPFNKNIELFANYLNDDLWSLREPPISPTPSDEITIGCMGGHSHRPDLLFILPVLKSIVDKYQPRIKLHFWGIDAPPELAQVSQVDWCPPPSHRYKDFASYFQAQSAEILIAPLADNLFNRCKSSIKYLEYTALGVPGVYSRLDPYETIVEDGVNGFLAGTHQEWEQALSTLIENPGKRSEIALNAQQTIRKGWLLSQNAHRLKDIYDKGIQDYPAKPATPPPVYPTMKSISHQVQEGLSYIKGLQTEISVLNQRNAKLTSQLDEREEEIVSYLTSPSWQLTRPLRKITSRLPKGKR